MTKENKQKLITHTPYMIAALLTTKLSYAWRYSLGTDLWQKILNLTESLSVSFSNPLPSFYLNDILIGITAAISLRLFLYFKSKNAKKYRKGIEYGSARWGNQNDIAPYTDPIFRRNIILTQSEYLTMSNRPKIPKFSRNNNVLIIGGSGSGKTRFWLKPNLMQCHSSYVVTDPKGLVLLECGNLLKMKGYRIKVLNTIDFKKSMHYNPFAYIHSEKDILKLVTTLITNTKGDGKSGDDFWVKAETLLYTALIGYIYYEADEDEKNFNTLIEFINASEVREDDEEFQNPVDELFDELEAKNPEHFAVRQYMKYKLAAGDVECNSNLNQLQIRKATEMAERTYYLCAILNICCVKGCVMAILYPQK